MRVFAKSWSRAAMAAAAAAVLFGFGGMTAAEAAPLGASTGTHVADVAKVNTGVEKVHRRWHHRRYYGYRPYYYYPYRRHYGYYYGGYPYYGGYGYRHWRRPGLYLRFGF